MGNLNHEVQEDISNKVKIVDRIIPEVIFGSEEKEENLRLALDMWNYHNMVGIES